MYYCILKKKKKAPLFAAEKKRLMIFVTWVVEEQHLRGTTILLCSVEKALLHVMALKLSSLRSCWCFPPV